MRKISLFLAFVLLLSLALVSCGEASEIDVDAAAEKICKSVKFSEELEKLDLETAKSVLLFDEDEEVEIAMYIGSGSSADQVIVAKGANFNDVTKRLKEYVETQREMYSWYMIDEAAKLGKAVFETSDDTVIVCVTDDVSNAGKVVKKILK